MLRELVFARCDWQTLLTAGHGGDALALSNRIRQVLVELFLEGWLVVPQIDL